MSSIIQNEKKEVFEFYSQLPAELRMAINDEMVVEDRCRFTRCSSLCQKEVRRSKNYVYGLEFYNFNKGLLEIVVRHNTDNDNYTNFGGYMLRFLRSGKEKVVEYSVKRPEVSWRMTLDDSTNLSEMAHEYFENLLQLYQNTIKKLVLHGTQNYNLQINRLINLEDLNLENHSNLHNVTSKLRRPLKRMCVVSTVDKVLNDCEKMYQVRDSFKSTGLTMNNDQFLRFCASEMILDVGELTPTNVSDFIKSWQNGKIRENFQSCYWNWDGSSFNLQEVFHLLRIQHTVCESGEFKLKHNMEAGKFAKLSYRNMGEWNNLDFEIFQYYPYLPPEMRMMIIDEMEPDDRCRFSRCSESSWREAKRSRKYLHGLEFYSFGRQSTIYVIHSPKKDGDRDFGGYTLTFATHSVGFKFVEYAVHGIGLWGYILDDSIDLTIMATVYFQNLLQFHQNTIKKLFVSAKTGKFKCEIRSLNNLEELEVLDHADFVNFLSIVRQPLKKLLYCPPAENSFLTDCEQMYQVRDLFQSWRLRMSYEQFLRFSAKQMIIHIGGLTPNNVFEFIRSWQNDTIRKSFEKCCWYLENSNFNLRELCRLLQIERTDSTEIEEFKIEHNKITGKTAKLCLLLYGGCERLEFNVL